MTQCVECWQHLAYHQIKGWQLIEENATRKVHSHLWWIYGSGEDLDESIMISTG